MAAKKEPRVISTVQYVEHDWAPHETFLYCFGGIVCIVVVVLLGIPFLDSGIRTVHDYYWPKAVETRPASENICTVVPMQATYTDNSWVFYTRECH